MFVSLRVTFSTCCVELKLLWNLNLTKKHNLSDYLGFQPETSTTVNIVGDVPNPAQFFILIKWRTEEPRICLSVTSIRPL